MKRIITLSQFLLRLHHNYTAPKDLIPYVIVYFLTFLPTTFQAFYHFQNDGGKIYRQIKIMGL
jgi:hypothetical protein